MKCPECNNTQFLILIVDKKHGKEGRTICMRCHSKSNIEELYRREREDL